MTARQPLKSVRNLARADALPPTTPLQPSAFEGVHTGDARHGRAYHPGVIHRGPAHDRWAALGAGPDVWEIVARLRELEGGEEERIATLAEETELHPRQIRIAVNYAADHPEEIEARIRRNEEAAEASRRLVEKREALLQ